MVLQTGEILNNRYRIVKLLGKGGFGAVYRVWDLNMECPRALKENLDTSPEAQKQFKLEARLLGQLTHHSLPNVIDHFILPGQGQYLVMDFVKGQDLQEMLDKQNGPLPESQVLPWIGQIGDALEYLHSQNPPIIHRDIKPANIKITPDGRAMLVDFGIAKVYDPSLVTTAGAKAVTPGYSPHEQYGMGKTDSRTDIYALGATLYTLLTGEVPVESIQRMIDDPLLPPDQANPAISSGAARAIQQAMAPNPDKRPASIRVFQNTLKGESSVLVTQPFSQTMAASMAGTQPVSWKALGTRWLIGAGVGVITLLGVYLLFLRNESIPSIEATLTATAAPTEVLTQAMNETLAEAEVAKENVAEPLSAPSTTPTLTQIPTHTPQSTLTLTLPPSHTPTTTPDPLKVPDLFIHEYHAAILRREYEFAFSLLSDRFKAVHHDEDKDGVFEIGPFIDWWNKIEDVKISKLEIQQQSARAARVYMLGVFTYMDGRVVEDQQIFHLISDGRGSWLIDDQGG